MDKHGNPVSQVIDVPQLDGSINISLGRFLHIDTDLLYHAPVEQVFTEKGSQQSGSAKLRLAQQNAGEAQIFDQLQGFHLKAHRKTRSKQTQFIDHPLFGVIVRITPVATS